MTRNAGREGEGGGEGEGAKIQNQTTLPPVGKAIGFSPPPSPGPGGYPLLEPTMSLYDSLGKGNFSAGSRFGTSCCIITVVVGPSEEHDQQPSI